MEALLGRTARARDLLLRLTEPVPPAVSREAASRLRARHRIEHPGWIRVVMMALVAITVFAIFALPRSGVEPPPPYAVVEVAGAVRAGNGEGRAAFTFLPRSHLVVVVAPDEEPPDRTPHLAVFVSDAGGPLRRVEAEIEQAGHAFRIDAEASAWFGYAPGPRVIFFGLAVGARRLAEVDGLRPAQARLVPGVRWVELPVDYRLTRPPAEPS